MKIISAILTILLQFLIVNNIKIFNPLYIIAGVFAVALISGVFLMRSSSNNLQKTYSIGWGMIAGTITSVLILMLVFILIFIVWPNR
jgi:hypothetical protein